MTADKTSNERKQLPADSETTDSFQQTQLDAFDCSEVNEYSEDFAERVLGQKESDFVEVDCDALISLLERRIAEARRIKALDCKEQGE